MKDKIAEFERYIGPGRVDRFPCPDCKPERRERVPAYAHCCPYNKETKDFGVPYRIYQYVDNVQWFVDRRRKDHCAS